MLFTICRFEIVSHLTLKNENSVDSLHWLSKNVVFLKVDKLTYYLLDTTKFKPGDKPLPSEDEDLEYSPDLLNNALVATGIFDNELADFKYPWENHTQLYLHNYTIVSKNNKFRIFIHDDFRIMFLESSTNNARYYIMYR